MAQTVNLGHVKGDKGADGHGVPTGGTAGQYLKKSSGTDYDTEWANFTNATQQASGLMSNTDKTKLDGMANTESAIAIVVDGDTAPKSLAVGDYLFIKNHSTLANGGYHVTSAITSGASITGSNVAADADGICNAIAGDVAALNSNITTINSNINNTKLGDFSSKSDLDTLLDTALSGMITNGKKTFRVTCNGSFGLFKNGVNYFCTLNKEGTSNTYSSVIVVESGGVNTYQGARNASGWTYFQINNTGMKCFWIDNNSSITYKNNGHLTFFVTASSNSNGIIALVTTTGSATAIVGSLPDSISVSSSGSGDERTITITNTVGWSIPVWVML